MTQEQILALRRQARAVQVSEKLADYILNLADATRKGKDFALPVSTRGVQGLFRATQALALCEGRGYALPDDVQHLAVPVLAHRMALKRGSGQLEEQRYAIRRILSEVPVPL